MRDLFDFAPMAAKLSTVAGTIGGLIASGLGGWDKGIQALIIMMSIDYVSGLIVAVAGKSKKTENGKLSSRAGLRGIAKKVMMLLMVAAGYLVDWLIGVEYLRDAVIIALVTNELISFVENYVLLGLPAPQPIKNIIEVLKKRDEKSVPEEIENVISGSTGDSHTEI